MNFKTKLSGNYVENLDLNDIRIYFKSFYPFIPAEDSMSFQHHPDIVGA